MKNLFLAAIAALISLSSLADPVQIGNATDQRIYVIVYFNDGSDCEPDQVETFCIEPYSSANIDVPGMVPFSARAMDAPLCAPDYSTDSWAHNDSNPFIAMCSTAPSTNVNPYVLSWHYYMGGGGASIWGISITE